MTLTSILKKLQGHNLEKLLYDFQISIKQRITTQIPIECTKYLK